jgi:hypothetical protein
MINKFRGLDKYARVRTDSNFLREGERDMAKAAVKGKVKPKVKKAVRKTVARKKTAKPR